MKYTDKGRLYVRAYTASGALPMPDTVVRITGVDEGNRYISFSRLTDENGVVLFDNLPAPTLNYSLSPSPAEVPYSVYDIEASKEGYYSKKKTVIKSKARITRPSVHTDGQGSNFLQK